MNSKSTWVWIVIAAALLAFIVVAPRLRPPPPTTPAIVSPEFITTARTVLVRPAGKDEIRACLTNAAWQLTSPILYPAQSTAIQTLLAKLAKLAPDRYITAGELRENKDASEEFGLVEPQFVVTLEQADVRRLLRFGARTAPGDQVFLQVVGVEGVYVVDAEILKSLPKSAADWRDPSLVDLRDVPFDRINITNGATAIELQVDPTNRAWSMMRPLHVRADNQHINDLLVGLHRLKAAQFVTDEPKADRERFGLQPAELSVTLSLGTNLVRSLLFGKNATNDPAQVYAGRDDFPSVVTVSREQIEPWRALPNAFRDRQLVSVKPDVAEIGFQTAGGAFTLQRTSSNAWSIASEKFPVDTTLVNEMIQFLNKLAIVQFRKDIVTEQDLPDLGLAAPALQITIRTTSTNATNSSLIETRLAFGTPQGDTVNVRRSDEDSVYAVALADFLQLPTAAWQLRERHIWSFSPADVARLESRQGSQSRTLVRTGTNVWSLAEGSQGVINSRDIENTVELFSDLLATFWVARAPQDMTKFGFGPGSLTITFELKDGTKRSLQIGGKSPTGYAYCSVVLDGETWVFELPFGLQQFAETFLALPDKQP